VDKKFPKIILFVQEMQRNTHAVRTTMFHRIGAFRPDGNLAPLATETKSGQANFTLDVTFAQPTMTLIGTFSDH
jgi:hypothetical protein